MHWGYIFTKVFLIWISAGILGFAYWAANFTTKSSQRHSKVPATLMEKIRGYFYGVLTVFIISFFILGYKTNFVIGFIALLAPVSLGIWSAYANDKQLTPAERDNLNSALIRNAIEAERHDNEGW